MTSPPRPFFRDAFGPARRRPAAVPAMCPNAARARSLDVKRSSAARVGQPCDMTTGPGLTALLAGLARLLDQRLVTGYPVLVQPAEHRGVPALLLMAKEGQMNPRHHHVISRLTGGHLGPLSRRRADSLRTAPLSVLIVAGRGVVTGGSYIRCAVGLGCSGVIR